MNEYFKETTFDKNKSLFEGDEWMLNESAPKFEMRTFRTNSGGRPLNANAVAWTSENTVYKYSTNANGSAFSWTGTVVCCPTGNVRTSDTFNGEITYTEYELEDGTVFEFGYGKGSPCHFDHATVRI